MRADPLAHQLKCHAKAQRAPRGIYRIPLSFLDIFLIPSHSIGKTIEGFSAKSSWRSCALAGGKNMKEIRAV